MEEKGAAPGSSDPSLDELHRMFEEKERVREEERKRLSRIGTKVLLAIPVVLLVAFLTFLAFPGKPEPATPAPESEVMAKAAEIQRQLANGGAPGADAGTVEADERRGDMQFALDLLRYMNPEGGASSRTEGTPASPGGK
jgi:hypothetical protein